MEFEDSSVVDEVIKGENHRDYNGQIIRVEVATGKSARDRRDNSRRDDRHRRNSYYKVEVTHLPYRCTWQVYSQHVL